MSLQNVSAVRVVAVSPSRERPAPLRAVRGRVETTMHAPIDGAAVQAVLIHDGRTWPVARVTTDATGAFTLRDLPEGSYWLIARAAGRARVMQSLRVHGATSDPVTLAMSEGNRVEGAITARDRDAARPFANALVRAFREGSDAAVAFVTRADAQGHFVFDELEAGTWRLEVAEAGYEPLQRVGVPAPSPPVALTVRALASIEGVVRTVHGDGARGASVLLAGSGVWPPRVITVFDDGRFLLPSLPAGVYELRASRDEDVSEPVAPLVLDPGDHRDVTLALGAGAALAGTVLDAVSRQPIPGARVVVAEDALSTTPRALVADARGAFRVAGLLRRSHQVSVRATGYAPRTGLVTTPGEAPLTLALDRAAVVEGRVLDGHGDPVPNARVELTVRDQDGQVSWLSGSTVAFRDALFTTQAQGPRPLIPAGELGVVPGRVPMVPLIPVPAGVMAERMAPGFTTDAEGKFHIEEVPPGVVSVAAQHPAYVRAEAEGRLVRAGERAEMDVVLHAGGTIDGRVVTERGFPMRGMQVEIRTLQESLTRRVFTANDGTFRAPSLRGHVVLVAWMGARVAARAEVDVADDATVPVTLTVPGALRRIEGRVVDARGFPVGAASVSITALDRGATGSGVTITQPDGTFDTVMGGTGAVTIDVRHPEYAPRGMRVEDPSRPLRIELSPGSALEFELRGDGCMSAEARVELRTPCGPLRVSARERETARVEHLCAGRATLVIDAPECIHAERSVTIPASGTLAVGAVDLVAGGSAEGEVLDARNEPVAGAVVARVDAPPDALTGAARTDRQGRFTVNNLPQGDLQVVAVHPTLGRSPAAPVRILRGTVARGVRLRYEREIGQAIRAVPVASVTLVDVPARGGGREVEVRAVSAGSTAERAGLRPGDHVLSVGATPVANAAEAERRMAGSPGDDVTLEVERDGARRTVRFMREGAR